MKRTLKLAEVCKQLDLPPYVLRYWETEFTALASAAKSGTAGRTYSGEDLALLRRIKRLLYEEGYTIAGAKKKLESEPAPRADAEAAGPLFAGAGAEAATPDAGSTPAAPALDSPADERIESLRRGITEALKEARAVLAILEKQSR
jgi:DNA-binding transcriptional MerR regulator